MIRICDQCAEHYLNCECQKNLYREFVFFNKEEGYLAFEVKNKDTKKHEYLEFVSIANEVRIF